MEWFIKKNATLPTLKVKVVKDGRSDFERGDTNLSESSVFFSMTDTETQIPKISSKPGSVISEINNEGKTEYYASYQFTKTETNKEGRYLGEFMILNDDGVIYLPINDKLFINVTESFSLDDSEFVDNYTIDYSCCPETVRPDEIIKYLSNQDGLKLVTNQGFSANTKYIITLNT